MAKTPYTDLSTQDILSAHISGLAHSVNKIEDVLNMKTVSVTNVTLNAVVDQQDTSIRYRIYEGSIRNWTAFTLYRNGTVVDAAEYTAQGGYGVVVFHTQQLPTDVITADITYIDASSTRLETIETNVSTNTTDIGTLETTVSGLQITVSGLSTDVSTHETEITTLQQDVAALQSAPSGGVAIPLKHAPAEIVNVRPGKTLAETGTPSSSILMVAGKIDAFPVIVERRLKITKMKTVASYNTTSGNLILGIYKDENNQPGELISQTAAFAIAASTTHIVDLTAPAYLEPGVYWLARYSSTGVRLDGHPFNADVHIILETSQYMDGTGTPCGVRTASQGNTLTALPTTFPPVGAATTDSKYLARAYLGTTYALT